MKKILFTILAVSMFSFQEQAPTIKIMAVGDIMMGTSFPNTSYLPKDGVDPFEKVNSVFQQADVLFGNLEGTLTDEGKNAKHCKDPSKCYSFKSPTQLATYLATSGFDVMSIANNHIGDFGNIGITNTIATLDSFGIASAGVYRKPYTTFTRNGVTYGFAAFAPNKDCIKINQITKAKEIVAKLEEIADIVIVSFHGGAEGTKHTRVPKKTEYYYGENRGDVHKFAHAVIDSGADLVFGHGPHVTRAMEVYKDRFIAYSLGNFCTYKRFNVSGVKGFAPIVEVDVDNEGRFVSGKVNSAKQRDGIYPYIDANNGAYKEMKKLTELDFPGVFDFQEDGTFYKK